MIFKYSASDWVLFLLRIGLGGVFLASGYNKLQSPPVNFALVIEKYEWVGPAQALGLAMVLPWCEWIAGFLLVAGYRIRLSAGVIGVMLIVFIVALSSALIRGINLADCGCFGEGIHFPPQVALLIDCGLLAATFLVIKKGKSPLSIDGLP